MAILGIDEVGRGPLAGPLLVGAVVFRPVAADSAWLETLRDSKKLSKTARLRLAAEIKERSFIGLGSVSAAEIDQVGISAALRLATRRAVKSIQDQKVSFHRIVIDGNLNFLSDTSLSRFVTTIVKADDVIKEVSAASIIAKVTRDQQMIDYAEKYPGYGFERHSGYGTAAHLSALRSLGPSAIHRRSFRPVAELVAPAGNQPHSATVVKNTTLNLVHSSSVVKNTTSASTVTSSPFANTTSTAKSAKSPKSTGDKAESIVAAYLVSLGHTILARNFRCPSFEIDIISARPPHIYFTEVRYRQNSNFGGGKLSITPAKLRQMTFAAEKFLASSAGRRLLAPMSQPASSFTPTSLDSDSPSTFISSLSPLLAVATLTGPDFILEDWLPLKF